MITSVYAFLQNLNIVDFPNDVFVHTVQAYVSLWLTIVTTGFNDDHRPFSVNIHLYKPSTLRMSISSNAFVISFIVHAIHTHTYYMYLYS